MKNVYNIESSEKIASQNDLLLETVRQFSALKEEASKGSPKGLSLFHTATIASVENKILQEKCHKAAITLL